MAYRYRMHCYQDRQAPLDAGRRLPGRTLAEVVAQAADLWNEGAACRQATGYVIMDTEEAEVVARRERDPPPLTQREEVVSDPINRSWPLELVDRSLSRFA